MPYPYFDPTERSYTLRKVDRLRDLLTVSTYLNGDYAGRAYRGEILDYHDLQGVAADASPLIAVMSAYKRFLPASAGPANVGAEDYHTRLVACVLVHVPREQDATTGSTVYREAQRLTDLVQDALVAVERDPGAGGGQCQWHGLSHLGTTLEPLENNGALLGTVMFDLISQRRKT